MTKEQLEAFLTDAGVAFAPVDAEEQTVIGFKNRGTSLRAVAYEGGDLLHLVCRYKLPEGATNDEEVQAVFQTLENEFPIVKLRRIGSPEAPGFAVSAEQFEPDPAAIASVFWRTADLLVTVADEGFRRLGQSPSAHETTASDERPQWIAGLEDALRKGCGTENADADAETAAVFGRVKMSLALVLTADCSTGSAFCVASDAESSYFVTSAHVVGTDATVTLYRQRPHFEKIVATLIAKASDAAVDLAVLRAGTKHVPPLKLHPKPPKDESAAALAGYARVQLWAAQEYGELIPSIHLGTVTGVLKDGGCVLHDVVCRPGNSGGPLFDPVTGEVLGVQEGGWQDDEEGVAIGVTLLAPFLKANNVPI